MIAVVLLFGLSGAATELGKSVGLGAVDDPAALGFDSAKLDAVFAVQKKLIADKLAAANAAIIARDGRVVYHRAAKSGLAHDRPITDDTVFPIWSMSKPITSVAAMILFDRGAFKLDDSVANALPELAKVRVKAGDGKTKPLARPITYRDLLRHTAGFAGYDGFYHQDGFWGKTTRAKSLEWIIGELVKVPIEHQPSARYTYGMSTAVLGRAVEALSGKSLDQFLRKEIFRPLGMKNTRFYLTKRNRKLFQPLSVFVDGKIRAGKPEEDELPYAKDVPLYLGGEGLTSTMADYARFCQMLVDGGKAPNGKQILKPATLKLMWTDQLGDIPGYDDRKKGNSFGLGFYVLNDFNQYGAEGVFGWGGYHTTHFWIDPKNEMYGIFLSRRYPFQAETLTRFRKAVYEAME
ncbi:MAG: beta-lactamase family protein [Verrucomicrobia bacterium]|nr:beta-lactamase family protein [Verrucomicrobiota bacterium]